MHILRIYPFIPPIPGGMEKHILRLTQEQRHLGCKIKLIFNQGEYSDSDDIRVMGWVNLRNIRYQVIRDFVFYTSVIFNVMTRRIHSDVVHVHGDWSAFFLARVVAWVTNAKLKIASIHGCVHKGKVHAFIYRYVLSGFDVIYCTGAGDAAYLRKIGVSSARFQNSGIDNVFFEKKNSGFCCVDVVCVANLVKVKNIDLILDIAKMLPHLQFELIGDGPLRNMLEKRCVYEGIHNVIFSGRLEPTQIVNKLQSAKIFLSTSFTEGTPTALLEAMACGLPIITSASNDYSSFLQNDKNGFVINGFEPSFYVKKIEHLVTKEYLRNRIADANRAESSRHAWPIVAARITEWMKCTKI